MVILTPKKVENIFVLTAAKNHTGNFADSPFGPAYCSSSNASLTAPSISTIIQCIFKTFQIIVNFSNFVFHFLNFFRIQTYKYQNVISTVKFCIPFYLIQWHFKGCNKHIKKCSSSERPCMIPSTNL